MNRKLLSIVAALILLLSACGQKNPTDKLTLLDYENNEVTFPQEKPVLFFFITTYT